MTKRKREPNKSYHCLNHYALSEVRKKICDGNYLIKENAKQSADQDFGWGISDIKKFYKNLKLKHFHKMDISECKSGVVIDAYKAYLYGEYVYTHFYIDDDLLVINSFHKQC